MFCYCNQENADKPTFFALANIYIDFVTIDDSNFAISSGIVDAVVDITVIAVAMVVATAVVFISQFNFPRVD